MVDRQMDHQKDESDPWHEWTLDVGSNGIGPEGADEDCSEAIPEVKEANKVEDGDTDTVSASSRAPYRQ
jgi:hypothetical protein